METLNITDREPLAYSVKTLAKAYGVSPGLIRLEIARGHLKVARIGRRIVVPRDAVAQWIGIASSEQGGRPDGALP